MTAELSDHVTVSTAPVASLFNVAVRVTALAPEPNVVELGIPVTDTVIALIVNVTVVVLVLSLAEMAVMVTGQSALSVAADGG